jgi:hypothetical protein
MKQDNARHCVRWLIVGWLLIPGTLITWAFLLSE